MVFREFLLYSPMLKRNLFPVVVAATSVVVVVVVVAASATDSAAVLSVTLFFI